MKTACDFRQQCMIKYPGLAEFHSRAEYLHAGLLEGDPQVLSYVPQPFRLRIGKRWYTPDCYVVTDEGVRRVLELKPRGEFPDDLREPLTQFFAQHRLVFDVLPNEAMDARAVEAENWLEIVRILHLGRDLITTHAEAQVSAQLARRGGASIGELVDAGDRARTYAQELALFRLLHRGEVRARLSDRPLDFTTEVALCA